MDEVQTSRQGEPVRAHRDHNQAQFFNNAQEPLAESLKLIDEIGGSKHFNHYPCGWTWAGNTPFRRWKRETYRGGASDPFIVSRPQRIKARGQVRALPAGHPVGPVLRRTPGCSTGRTASQRRGSR